MLSSQIAGAFDAGSFSCFERRKVNGAYAFGYYLVRRQPHHYIVGRARENADALVKAIADPMLVASWA